MTELFPDNRSQEINELTTALAKAQGVMEAAKADSTNPHFKSTYADLASAWNAAREALSSNGIAVVQIPSAKGSEVTVETMLTHSSGQFIKGSLTMTAQKNTPQGIGSCITYARRYALMAYVGLAPEDDDGNEASSGGNNRAPAPKKPALTQPQLQRLYTLQGQSAYSVQELKDKIKTKFGVESSRDLTREQYDVVCQALLDNPKPKEEPKPDPKTVDELKEEGVVESAAEMNQDTE
jgi:hypothetical protein